MAVRYEDRQGVSFRAALTVKVFLPIGGWDPDPDRACAGIIEKIPDKRCFILENNSTRQD